MPELPEVETTRRGIEPHTVGRTITAMRVYEPRLRWPKLRVLRRLAAKKLGFRTLFDVIPLTPYLVRGSHGLPAADAQDRPVLVGDGPAPQAEVSQRDVRDLVLQALGVGG